MNCPHCHQELSPDNQEMRCPNCGADLTALPIRPVAGTPELNKGTYWLIFWLAFFGSPILVFAAAAARAGSGILVLPILGAIVAGFSLAKIYTKTPAAWIVLGIVFSLGVLIIYVGIVFVGCLVMLGHDNF